MEGGGVRRDPSASNVAFRVGILGLSSSEVLGLLDGLLYVEPYYIRVWGSRF